MIETKSAERTPPDFENTITFAFSHRQSRQHFAPKQTVFGASEMACAKSSRQFSTRTFFRPAQQLGDRRACRPRDGVLETQGHPVKDVFVGCSAAVVTL